MDRYNSILYSIQCVDFTLFLRPPNFNAKWVKRHRAWAASNGVPCQLQTIHLLAVVSQTIYYCINAIGTFTLRWTWGIPMANLKSFGQRRQSAWLHVARCMPFGCMPQSPFWPCQGTLQSQIWPCQGLEPHGALLGSVPSSSEHIAELGEDADN